MGGQPRTLASVGTTLASPAVQAAMGAKQVSEAAGLREMSVDELQGHRNSVCGVVGREALDEFERTGEMAKIYESPVCGIATLKRVDEERQIVDVLTPQGGKLPTTTFIFGGKGELTWVE